MILSAERLSRIEEVAGRVARSLPFRAFVAVLILGIHLALIAHYANAELGLPFNRNAGEHLELLVDENYFDANFWNRLVVARWDSGHYIKMAMDGIYGHCPTGQQLSPDELERALNWCDLSFFPGYPILGWLASLGGRLEMDWALLGVSLASSFVLLLLWTGRTVERGLGLWGAYCSMLLMNVHTTGFVLVTILTEPCALLLTFLAFLGLERRRFILGALCAGAATAIRVNAVALWPAYVAAMLVDWWDQHLTSTRREIAVRLAAIALSGWGIVAWVIYCAIRFRDPFIYSHAHAALFEHKPELWHVFFPAVDWVRRSFHEYVHDVAIAALTLLVFALGHREGLRGFSRPSQAYWYFQFAGALFIAIYGSAQLGYPGVSRYTLMLTPAFFALAALMKRKPAAIAVWCILMGWHYYNADLCWWVRFQEQGGWGICAGDTLDQR